MISLKNFNHYTEILFKIDFFETDHYLHKSTNIKNSSKRWKHFLTQYKINLIFLAVNILQIPSKTCPQNVYNLVEVAFEKVYF